MEMCPLAHFNAEGGQYTTFEEGKAVLFDNDFQKCWGMNRGWFFYRRKLIFVFPAGEQMVIKHSSVFLCQLLWMLFAGDTPVLK